MSKIRATIVYRTLFIAAAIFNLLVFLFGGFDIDKLVIAGLFISITFTEVAMEDYRRTSLLQDQIIGRQTDLIARQRQAMGES